MYLNGELPEIHEYKGMYWYDWHGPSYSLMSAKMMIRPKTAESLEGLGAKRSNTTVTKPKADQNKTKDLKDWFLRLLGKKRKPIAQDAKIKNKYLIKCLKYSWKPHANIYTTKQSIIMTLWVYFIIHLGSIHLEIFSMLVHSPKTVNYLLHTLNIINMASFVGSKLKG